MTPKSRIFIASVLIAAIVGILLLARSARAETMVVERVVPPGAQLTYSEGGVVVRSINVPEGRVRVTIEFNAAIQPRHSRGARK